MAQVQEPDGWAPRGIDVSVPHSARIYDWWLGGKDNFAADRAMGEEFIRVIPTMRAMALENRRFVDRAVRYLVREGGIRQFLDIGTGIPTSPNLHEAAQSLAPEARVVYTDNDPIVLAHARALMTSTPAGVTRYVEGDLCEPEKLLLEQTLSDTLDLTKPVGLMLLAILMLLQDSDDPYSHVRYLMDALPSGSYLAITHPGRDFNPEAVAATVEMAVKGNIPYTPRIRSEVESFFDGWEIVEPGIVPVMAWRPDGEPPVDPYAAYYWGGVARKP